MRIRSLILSITLFSLLSSAHAQQGIIDSLLGVLKQHKPTDTTYLNTLAILGVTYQHINKDSMFVLSDQLITASQSINYARGIAAGHKIKGIGYIQTGDKSLALYHDSIAIHFYKLAKDKVGLGAVYNNMAVLFNTTGEYFTARSYYEKSLAIRMDINDIKGIGDSYNNLGNNELALGNYDNAIEFLHKGLGYRRQINYIDGIINSLMNLGNAYYYMGNLGKSEAKYFESINLAQNHQSFVNKAEIYNNLGGLFFGKNKYDSATYYFNKSLNEAKTIGDNETKILAINNLIETRLEQKKFTGIESLLKEAYTYLSENAQSESAIITYLKFAQYYSATGNHLKAIDFAQKGYERAVESYSKRACAEAAHSLASVHERARNFEKAFYYQKLYKTYSDSLVNEETIRRVSDFQYKYDLEQKDREITMLEQEAQLRDEKNTMLTIAFGLTVLLLLGSGITLYVVYANKQKQQKINELVVKQKATLEELDKFKSKLFSIIAHDLRSPIASIVSILNLHRDGIISDKDFFDAEQGIIRQTKNLSLLVDNLLKWAKSQMDGKTKTNVAPVIINDLVKQNLELLGDSFSKKGIIAINQLNPETRVMADRDQMDVVFRNLLSNALKFSKSGQKITLSEEHTATEIQYKISDEGIGMDEATIAQINHSSVVSKPGTSGELGVGIGLTICKEFAANNNCKLTFSSKPGNGTTVTLTFLKP